MCIRDSRWRHEQGDQRERRAKFATGHGKAILIVRVIIVRATVSIACGRARGFAQACADQPARHAAGRAAGQRRGLPLCDIIPLRQRICVPPRRRGPSSNEETRGSATSDAACRNWTPAFAGEHLCYPCLGRRSARAPVSDVCSDPRPGGRASAREPRRCPDRRPVARAAARCPACPTIWGKRPASSPRPIRRRER